MTADQTKASFEISSLVDKSDNTLCLQLETGNTSNPHIAHTMTVNEKSVQIGSAQWNVGY